MDDNIIGNQIMLLRKRFGLTQEDLAVKLGYSKQTVSNWETGLKTPRMGAIQKISDLFNVSKSFIIEGVQPTTTLSLVTETTAKLHEKRQKNVLGYAEKELAEQNEIISLDNYREGRQAEHRGALGAGVGVDNFYEDIANIDDHEWPMIDVPDDAPHDFDWVYTASGDSMEPVFKDGDIVYAKELDAYERSNIMPDTIYVVRVNSDSYLKKIRTTEHGAYLVSLNPQHEDIPLSPDDDISIVAKVVM